MTTRRRCCRFAVATSTLAWFAREEAMGKVSGNLTGFVRHGERRVAGGGRPERTDVVKVGRILRSQKGSHEKRDLLLIHEVQQGLIVHRRIGAIVLVEQFEAPMGREDAPRSVDPVDTQFKAEQLGAARRAVGPAQRQGSAHLDDGGGVAVPCDRIDGRGHADAGRGLAARQDRGGNGRTNERDHANAGATVHGTATPRYDSITWG